MEKRFPMLKVSHRGVLKLLQAPETCKSMKVGNHSMTAGITRRYYFYHGNLIVVERPKDRTFWVNPRWLKYSVSTTRAHNAYRSWFAQAGYEEVKLEE